MSGGDGLLREVRPEDVPLFYEHQADPVASALAVFPSRGRDEFYEHWNRNVLAGEGINRTIEAGGVAAGFIVAFPRDGVWEIGYWLGRAHWGRGLATRAVIAFTGIVTRRPLYAKVAVTNAPSLRVLDKAGFRLDHRCTGSDGITEAVLILD